MDVARAEVDRILATHHPEPLDPAQLRELERIVAAADATLGATAVPAGGRS